MSDDKKPPAAAGITRKIAARIDREAQASIARGKWATIFASDDHRPNDDPRPEIVGILRSGCYTRLVACGQPGQRGILSINLLRQDDDGPAVTITSVAVLSAGSLAELHARGKIEMHGVNGVSTLCLLTEANPPPAAPTLDWIRGQMTGDKVA